jgi:hypothetical protein
VTTKLMKSYDYNTYALFLNNNCAFLSGIMKVMKFVSSGRLPSFVVTSYPQRMKPSNNLSMVTAKKRPGLALA